ncbi:facilitated trehalose transporter Tret1-2 homolog isoform X2 [Ceratitis capitata]|uniref:facilitated trehalose transporter Tret1-2 homolog isoform X2 n=1 Tax=Ceratitis capitata TaxID=7213 RepID=UPI0006188E66|nr:facilitated trehalose transporter Tret1-2 homolog isoform X2 [Ceratitis capitata]
MLLNLCKNSEGVFRSEFRLQLLAAASVTIITFCHGISSGWFAPTLFKLQTPTESPLDFDVSVEQGSWMGAFISVGGFTGTVLFGQLMDRIGRKACIYGLVLPHIGFWLCVYFAQSIEYLYLARFLGGITGGGTYVVIPIFIGEIVDPTIRGRLTSLFTLTLNSGMLAGFTLSSNVPYHIIPLVVISLPLLFLLIETFFPETPTFLLYREQEEKAEKSFKFYQSYKAGNKEDIETFNAKFSELRDSVLAQKSQTDVVTWRDFVSKRALRTLGMGIMLMIINVFTGSFALLNYTSSIFFAIETDIHPNTNTTIIGVVQIIGTITAIILVDRYGRKILLMFSTAAMGICLAGFGLYAFFAEETSVDLTPYRSWLPLLFMALIILSANVGVIPVTFVVLVEILPAKIRAKAASICLALLSIFTFIMIKVFPPFMHTFGLSATMWACASFAALGLFYISIFLPETKGKSMNKDDV